MVMQLHRMSGDNSSSSVARAIQLADRISVVDSVYRVKLADFLWLVESSTQGSLAAARFPVALAPAPLLRPFGDGEDWMLQTPMVFKAGKTHPFFVIVPRGFVTDFASIPRPLRLLLPKTGTYGNAAIVHDYLYWRQDCSRSQSDNIMAIAMIEEGVPSGTMRAIQVGVRIGGQGAWDTNRRDRQSGLVRTVAPPFDQVPPAGTWTTYREWIRTNKGNPGVEYPVPQSVCSRGDSDRVPD